MFALRRFFNNARGVLHYGRFMSRSKPLVGMDIDDEGIATVTMQRPPVNSLNLEMLQELCNSFDYVAQNNCKGMILMSSLPKIFSAGLDIKEMYKPDMKRAQIFLALLQEVWIKLYGSNYATAAVINGHAPAMACILALCCENRVMTHGKYTIGINEATLGITAPNWVVDTMRNTISQRQTELAITMGKLFSVEEALKVGLIDETAIDKADAIEKCYHFIKKFDKISPLTRAVSKRKIREGPLTWMQKNRQQDMRDLVENITNPHFQQTLESIVNMKQKK